MVNTNLQVGKLYINKTTGEIRCLTELIKHQVGFSGFGFSLDNPDMELPFYVFPGNWIQYNDFI